MGNKLLLLGGSYGQVPAIKEAKGRGLYTILCDYLEDNPGREIADEYHNISTTDKEAVLDLALQTNPDFIMAYASDPATPTAAYVSETLGLPGNSYESILLLSEKQKYRKFLLENGFNTPAFEVYGADQLSKLENSKLSFPVVIKPVDSSDTKGVSKIYQNSELLNAAKYALRFSRLKKIIIEEFVDADIANLHGDAFIKDGKMIFCMLGDRLFSSISNPLKPSTELYPSRISQSLITKVENEIANIIELSGYKNGPVNIEARINSENEIYVMEIGPRSGGTLTPQAIYYSAGFDMLKASFDLMEFGEVHVNSIKPNPSICYALHTNIDGIFEGFTIDNQLKQYTIENHLYVKPGDEVNSYQSPGSTIGVLLLKFSDFHQLDAILNNLYDQVQSGVLVREIEAVRI